MQGTHLNMFSISLRCRLRTTGFQPVEKAQNFLLQQRLNLQRLHTDEFLPELKEIFSLATALPLHTDR